MNHLRAENSHRPGSQQEAEEEIQGFQSVEAFTAHAVTLAGGDRNRSSPGHAGDHQVGSGRTVECPPARATEAIEISYDHTARDGSQGYLTKTQTVTLTTAKEAHDAAEAILKKIDSWEKLREHMLVDIKRRQRQLDEIDKGVSSFVDYARSLLQEVFATLH